MYIFQGELCKFQKILRGIQDSAKAHLPHFELERCIRKLKPQEGKCQRAQIQELNPDFLKKFYCLFFLSILQTTLDQILNLQFFENTVLYVSLYFFCLFTLSCKETKPFQQEIFQAATLPHAPVAPSRFEHSTRLRCFNKYTPACLHLCSHTHVSVCTHTI